jgi:tetratricopeptide (TPR) repeat protein
MKEDGRMRLRGAAEGASVWLDAPRPAATASAWQMARAIALAGFSAMLLPFFLSAASAQAPSSTGSALAEINKGNLFEGVRLLKEVVRLDPSSAAAHFYLSSLYTGIGRFDTAYSYLQAAMKSNPGQGAHHHQLGILRRHEGCRPEALASFQHALKAGMGKDEATVWRHIGDVQVDLLAWNEAIDAYHNALRLDRNDAASHLALGRIYLERNDPERAVHELLAAQKAQPGLEGVYAKLGLAYRAMNDLPSAVAILKLGIERNASDQESRYVLGQVLMALGRIDEGRREMDAYGKLLQQMTTINSLFESAVQRAREKDLVGAEELFRETLRLAPRYAPALHLLGVVLLNRGDPRRALEALQQASSLNPLNSEIYFQMASAQFRAGNLTQALDMSQRALILDNEDPRYYTLLRDIYSKLNRSADARTATERAAQLATRPGYRPTDPYASEMRPRDDAATVKEICGRAR